VTGPDDRTPNLNLTSGSGITLSEGNINLSRTADQLKGFRDHSYMYFLILTYPDGSKKLWLNGKFKVNEELYDSPVSADDELVIALNGAPITLTITGTPEGDNSAIAQQIEWQDLVINDSGPGTIPVNTPGQRQYKWRLFDPTGANINESTGYYFDINGADLFDELWLMIPIVIVEGIPVSITFTGDDLFFVPSNWELRANENVFTFTESGTYILHFVREQTQDAVDEAVESGEPETFPFAYPIRINYECVHGQRGKIPTLGDVLNHPADNPAVTRDLILALASDKIIELTGMLQFIVRTGGDLDGAQLVFQPGSYIMNVTRDGATSYILINNDGAVPFTQIAVRGEERLTFSITGGRRRMLLEEIPVITDGILTALSNKEVYVDNNGFLKLKP
jgi:hypothetical protein